MTSTIGVTLCDISTSCHTTVSHGVWKVGNSKSQQKCTPICRFSILKEMFCSRFVHTRIGPIMMTSLTRSILSCLFLWRDSWTGGACNYTKKSNTCNKTFSINMRDYLWYVPPAAIHKAAPHSERRKHSYTIFTKTVETRQSKQCGFSIYTFDNLKSKSMVRLVRAEKMVLSGLVFARKIARMILIQNI